MKSSDITGRRATGDAVGAGQSSGPKGAKGNSEPYLLEIENYIFRYRKISFFFDFEIYFSIIEKMWACQDASIQVCRTAPRHGMHKHVVAMHFKVGYKFVQFLKHNSRSLSLVFQLHTTRYFHVNLVWIFRCRTTNSSQLYRIGSSFDWFYGRRPKRETGLPSATAAHSYTRATNTAMVPT